MENTGSGYGLAAKLVGIVTMISAMSAILPAPARAAQSYQGAPLPRPDVVVVIDFDTTSDAVKLDSSPGTRLRDVVTGRSAAARQAEDERKVSAAISKVLVEEIRKLGLSAVQANDSGAMAGANKLVVNGKILSIDEGNRKKRNLIGLGAGMSDVQAVVDVYYGARGATPIKVESFAAAGESPRRPGAAETMGAGAAAGRLAESSAVGIGTGVAPALSGDVDADAQRLAKATAKQLGQFFVSQGWIPAPAH